MQLDNFVSFSIVFGFFMGLFVSLMKFDSPEMITLFTFFITIAFYLIMMLSVSFFTRFFDFKKATIHKDRYDSMLEYFIQEFDKREKATESIREFIRSLEHSKSTEEEIIKPSRGKPQRLTDEWA